MTYPRPPEPEPTAQIPVPQPRRRGRTLLIVGAASAVVLIAVLAVVIVALTGGKTHTAAGKPSPSPSWSPMSWAPDTTTAPAQPTNTSFALGDTISTTSTSAAGGSKADWTVSADKQYRRTPDGYTGPQNGTFYGIRVSVSVSSGSQYVYSDDFALIGPDGTTYQATSSMYSFPSALQGTTVNAGQKVSGLVVFDVPPTALAGGKIELRPDGQALSNGQAFWALS